MRGITKRFPGVVANEQVDFEALEGEIHALLGENGAGKSTLSSILTGLYRPDEGEILVRGNPVAFHSPRDAIEAGIGMVHQHFRLAASFTVAENLVLGHRAAADRCFLLEPRVIQGRVAELARRYRMPVDPGARVWQLSVGEQQRVEILKAQYRGARILILDEPTSLLTPQESKNLFATLRLMVAEGRTVIFISHKLEEVMAVSTRVTVLRQGKLIGTVLTKETNPRQLARMMVGRDVVFTQKKEAVAQTERDVVLDLRGVTALSDLGTLALQKVDLTVHAGEIVGIAGVAGNGQRELAEVITGMRRLTSGTVSIAGRAMRSGDPLAAIQQSVSHVPEDRMGHGVAPAPQTPTRLLSGGNVQKVLLARELSSRPKVLVAASPTRGLDVAATDAVRGLLLEAAARGVAILLISEDLDEILALADRIAVLYGGRIMGVVERQKAVVEELGLMMAGAA